MVHILCQILCIIESYYVKLDPCKYFSFLQECETSTRGSVHQFCTHHPFDKDYNRLRWSKFIHTPSKYSVNSKQIEAVRKFFNSSFYKFAYYLHMMVVLSP